MRHLLSALLVGLLFGAGLALGGMTLPEKIVGFLDVTGDWDPSLLFVMGGAVLSYAALYRRIARREGPLFGASFQVPTNRRIDRRLVVGSLLFGAGWGLGGLCPGPALTSLATGATEVVTFVAAMLGGMFLFRVYEGALARRRAAQLHGWEVKQS